MSAAVCAANARNDPDAVKDSVLVCVPVIVAERVGEGLCDGITDSEQL